MAAAVGHRALLRTYATLRFIPQVRYFLPLLTVILIIRIITKVLIILNIEFTIKNIRKNIKKKKL